MAKYYAEIVNGIVVRVLVLNGEWTNTQCLEWLFLNVSTNLWKETDLEGNLRGKYAGIGDEFKVDEDTFVRKPFDSWVYSKDQGIYLPPIPKPVAVIVGYIWFWSETAYNWLLEIVA